MANIPIFLSSDNNYAPFVATTMASILDNTQSFVEFYVLDGGISEENQEKICSLKNKFDNFKVEFIKIDPNEAFKSIDYRNNEYISLSTYNRFLIPELKPALGKVLYLDVDVVVLSDVSKLYNTDLGDYALGAAWDKSRVLYNTDTQEPMELSDDYKYFNAGVLILDIPKWIKDGVVAHLFDIEKRYGKKVLHADETLLNKYFDGNYKIFDISWNYTDYDIVNAPDKEVKIRHFASALKPWTANYCWIKNQVIPLPNFDDFWRYAEMTPFYDAIKARYDQNINKSPLTKRMSQIADNMKNG